MYTKPAWKTRSGDWIKIDGEWFIVGSRLMMRTYRSWETDILQDVETSIRIGLCWTGSGEFLKWIYLRPTDEVITEYVGDPKRRIFGTRYIGGRVKPRENHDGAKKG